MSTEKTQIYHERQSLQFCLLHSLNNLLQEKNAFTRASLNEISEKLVLDETEKKTWTPLTFIFKPHHNAITGDYDINVLIAALEAKGKTVTWHDRRNRVSTIDLDGAENSLMGMVLNVKITRFGGIWKSRHWIALRKIDGVWYNLDSDLVAPQAFKDTEEFRMFLDHNIGHGAELLLVMNNKD